ncbi:MAG: galactose-1-phosphate uridylyltransferase [Candidatus Woesearchaeota archaeon]
MELRKDYLVERYVIVSETRGKRPQEFKQETSVINEEKCFFCPGNEHLTPPEILRINDDKGNWKIRVIPNKFPAAEPKGNYEIRTDNKYYTFSDAYGYHEIVIETRDHKRQMWDLNNDEIKDVLKVYCERINALSRMPGVEYVSVFKNSGKEGGTSIIHTHTQIITTNILPLDISEEIKAIQKYDNCPYCEIIENEKKSYRRCFENNNFVAFTPYASRFHYEIWVFPKRHLNSIIEMEEYMLLDLASIMKQILEKIKELKAPYNMYIHYLKDKKYHFHICFCPRLAIWGGFELSTGMIINSVAPERAAAFYRGEIKPE